MSLEKALRLAALTCRTAEKTNNGNEVGSSRKLHQGSKFGLYSVSEVLAVIRLFRVLDDDSSNTVTLNELQQLRPFLEKLGHHTVSTAFQTIDKDSDGHIRLSELLGCCFPHASALQIDEMLKLGQVDNLRQYFQNESKHPAALVSGLSDSVEPKNKDELHEIFRLYDKNGDGYISLEEMVEAVRVDDNTSEGEQVGRTRSPVECSTWRRSSGITRADMERFYAESDANADNLLDFDEFVDLMRELHLFE
ncbi:TPA: hypothetical protein N0F65_000740 [Lagenidium giganteum]|uniref:EF-hand domain-containing protein n=1 Tax=Lagenidium giganteum TaxID=4803 RepID=A0AAV2ZKM5_9STRA|nr:TPA: hypothetical protein N0F65_000740 [Lagenidium giganteum]